MRRRNFLQAGVAVGTVFAAGCTGGKRSPAGYVSIIVDDGYNEDYDVLYNVTSDLSAVACTAPIYNNIDSGSGWLTSTEIDEMVNDGWEVVSHGMAHRDLSAAYLTQDATSDDSKIHFNENLHGFKVSDDLLITDDSGTAETVTIAENNDPDDLVLTADLDNSYSEVDGARVYYDSEMINQEVGKSMENFQKRGWDVDYYVLPYGSGRGEAKTIIGEYYNGILNTGSSSKINKPIDPMYLNRKYMDDDKTSDSELKSWLDDLATNYEYGLLGGHTSGNFTEQRASDVIQWARDRNIEVVTVSMALENL